MTDVVRMELDSLAGSLDAMYAAEGKARDYLRSQSVATAIRVNGLLSKSAADRVKAYTDGRKEARDRDYADEILDILKGKK